MTSPLLLLVGVCFACVTSKNNVSNKSNITSVTKLDMYFYLSGHQRFPTDCNDVFVRGGKMTGIYIIKPEGAKMPYMVRCEMDGAPWTVLMKRYRGSVDFDRTWKEYKNGFGNPESEFWVGNELIHYLTTQRPYKARFDMKIWSTRKTVFSEFSHFWVGPESIAYQLSISGESGTATRGRMSYHNGMKFTTRDRHNDNNGVNCAVLFSGGWLFNVCYTVKFTGPYDDKCPKRCNHWISWQPLKEMQIRVTRI